MIALGTACVSAADDSYSSAEAGKLWKVTASLRGFYDDNVNNVSSGTGNRTSTTGFSLNPGFSLNWQRDSTTLMFGYRYSLLYYGVKPVKNVSHIDQDHMLDVALTHLINERYKFSVSDGFVIGQEPDTLRSGDALTTTQRIPGDNIRNTGALVFNAELTPLFGLEAGYENSLFDYSAHGATVRNITVGTNSLFFVTPSESGTSDRMEHTLHLDGRWQWRPQTTAILGYKFRMVNYTGNEVIAITPSGSTRYMSNTRDSRTHTADVGLEHIFNPDFQVSARVGISFADYYKDPTSPSSVSPYVNLRATYGYAPESTVQAGFTYDRNATDSVGGISATKGLTTSQESATLFATITHRIVPGLFGSVTAQYQDSTYVGGTLDSQNERYLLLGLNLSYKFAHYLSAELGYDYDNISSKTGHSYDRNRIYLGLTGSY